MGTYLCQACLEKTEVIQQSEAICPVCERNAIDGRTHPRCRSRYSLDGLTSYYHYRGTIKKLVKAIKYRFQSDLTKTLPLLLHSTPAHMYLQSVISSTTVLYPIPLHIERLRFRGFNQAEEIGKVLGNQYNIPIYHDMIRRIKRTLPQVDMKSREQRLQNMKGVFALSPNKELLKSILLVDDVFTTGTTMREVCGVLKRGGAESVWGVTLAR